MVTGNGVVIVMIREISICSFQTYLNRLCALIGSKVMRSDKTISGKGESTLDGEENSQTTISQLLNAENISTIQQNNKPGLL